MKEVTIGGITYVPVVHTSVSSGVAKCKDCVAYNTTTMNATDLCIKLPNCWDAKHTCHFVVKEEE